jgi:16S rRNA pseudouridine516 synthase
MRLDKIVQAARKISLKQAQQMIKRGEVAVDGQTCDVPKYQILPGVEHVTADGAEVSYVQHPFYVMHKPVACLCQRHPHERTVYDLIPEAHRRPDLVAFGRLDVDTTGVLLFGTDGGTQSMLTFPTSRVWKTYVADLAEGSALAADAASAFAAGIRLEDGTECAPAELELVAARRVRVHVHEGMFRQVKRMLASQGGRVIALHRERFGAISDAGLPPGAMRRLTEAAHSTAYHSTRQHSGGASPLRKMLCYAMARSALCY